MESVAVQIPIKLQAIGDAQEPIFLALMELQLVQASKTPPTLWPGVPRRVLLRDLLMN
jgi:hypothetical protein